ncbi:hypothetical protein ACVNIS_20915 [Sphaerotilaceae bacterium SBD11-9]
MRVALAMLAMLPSLAVASEALVSDLERRLQTDGVESVNLYLREQTALMAELNQGAADCSPQAIDLAVKLSRTTNTKAGDLHRESLRLAVGACTEFVLSRLSLNEVPRICAAASSWTVSQTARELRRRIRQIEADESLSPTPRGMACHAAYVHELHTTRVGVRAGPPLRR